MTIASVVAVAALCLVSSSLAVGQTSEQATVEKHITGTLRQMYEAEKRKDLDFVLSNFADDFAEVAGDGRVYRREDIQAGWSEMSLHDYKLSDCLFKLMTHDAAYLSCDMEVDASYKGQRLPTRFRVTTVWTWAGGRWLLRFEQGTTIAERPKASH